VKVLIILRLTSKRSHGRGRSVNEKEIEVLTARCEPRLVRLFWIIHVRC
jgi:hypothetical protein